MPRSHSQTSQETFKKFLKVTEYYYVVDNHFTGLKVVFRDWKSDVFLMYFSSAYLFHFNFCGIIYRNLKRQDSI